MQPLVSIILGSNNDLPVMEKAANFFEEMEIPFEMGVLSAHRTPNEVGVFARTAKDRGIKIIIAGAGMAAHLAGVIASFTTIPVIGVPLKGALDGLDAMLAIAQMPAGIPVAAMGTDAAQNAAIFAAEILAMNDEVLGLKLAKYRSSLVEKVAKANEDLSKCDKYKFQV